MDKKQAKKDIEKFIEYLKSRGIKVIFDSDCKEKTIEWYVKLYEEEERKNEYVV